MGTVKMRSLTVVVVFVFAGKAIFPVEGTRLKEQHDDIGGEISDQSKRVWSDNGLGWMLGKSSNYLKAGMMLVSIAHGVSSKLFSSKKTMASIRKGGKEEVSWNLRENSEQFLNQALKNDLKIFLDDHEAAEDSAERFCGDKEEKEYKKGCLVYNCTSTGFNTVKVLEKCQQMMKAHIEEIIDRKLKKCGLSN